MQTTSNLLILSAILALGHCAGKHVQKNSSKSLWMHTQYRSTSNANVYECSCACDTVCGVCT